VEQQYYLLEEKIIDQNISLIQEGIKKEKKEEDLISFYLLKGEEKLFERRYKLREIEEESKSKEELMKKNKEK